MTRKKRDVNKIMLDDMRSCFAPWGMAGMSLWRTANIGRFCFVASNRINDPEYFVSQNISSKW